LNYLKITDSSGKETTGGSQMWFKDPVMVNSGCGIVAALDNFLVATGVLNMEQQEYLELLENASTKVRPLRLPFFSKPIYFGAKRFLGSFGVTVFGLKRGIKRLSEKTDKTVKVVTYGTTKIDRVLKAIGEGRSVIMLVRTPFAKIRLYSETDSNNFTDINYHWVTVVDADEKSLTVSSWGRRYKINIEDISKFSILMRFAEVLTI